jgi:hypothetical protein
MPSRSITTHKALSPKLLQFRLTLGVTEIQLNQEARTHLGLTAKKDLQLTRFWSHPEATVWQERTK